MQASALSPLGNDVDGVISWSLDAALEIERSRLSHDCDESIVRRFGQILKDKAGRPVGGARKGFADPSYAQPLSSLYVATHSSGKRATTEDVVAYWDAIATQFLKFTEAMSDAEKASLVQVCAKLHQFLSDELRNHEEIGSHGWWH